MDLLLITRTTTTAFDDDGFDGDDDDDDAVDETTTGGMRTRAVDARRLGRATGREKRTWTTGRGTRRRLDGDDGRV